MDTLQHFIEPLDVLFLRGNKLFGDPGSFGEALVPPWPSVAAGAIRSALLVHKGVDLQRFAKGEVEDPEMGKPEQPGKFRVTDFRLALRFADGRVEPLYAPPADLVIRRRDDGMVETLRMRPHALPGGIESSSATAMLAVLPERERGKAEGGYWLTQEGWQAYLAGRNVDPQTHLVKSSDLWKLDSRVGVGLDPVQRKAADGKLFTVQAVALRKRHHGGECNYDVGFLAETTGADIPKTLALRFGGDGRGAIMHVVQTKPMELDYDAIVKAGRCRIVLTSPGIFEGGWKFLGLDANNRLALAGVTGRLVCAAVPRAEVVSGFDLAKWQPKAAQRVAPTGSVYWLDDVKATPETFRRLTEDGLWPDPVDNPVRRAEGFNRFTFAMS